MKNIKLKTFDSSYFIGKSHFEEDGAQNYLVFQSMYRYFKQIAGVGNGSYIYYCQLKDCLTKKLILLKHLIIVLLQTSNYYGTKTRVEFNENCLKQDSVIFHHEK